MQLNNLYSTYQEVGNFLIKTEKPETISHKFSHALFIVWEKSANIQEKNVYLILVKLFFFHVEISYLVFFFHNNRSHTLIPPKTWKFLPDFSIRRNKY